MIQAVAQRLNKSVEFSSMPFNMLFAAVQSGRADVALGAITITANGSRTSRSPSPSSIPTSAWPRCRTVPSSAWSKGRDVGVITGTVGEIWAARSQQEHAYKEIRATTAISSR